MLKIGDRVCICNSALRLNEAHHKDWQSKRFMSLGRVVRINARTVEVRWFDDDKKVIWYYYNHPHYRNELAKC